MQICPSNGILQTNPLLFAVLLLTIGFMAGPVWADEGATIVINVKAQGGDDTFGFSGDLGDFEVTSNNGEAQHILDGMTAGDYSITGNAPGGWDEFGIMCHSHDADIDFDTFSVLYQLSAGDSISCTYIFRAQ